MRIAIIGGGAAGLMTAATLLESSAPLEVLLIEKNNGLGKKVLIAGGGRCNLTTGTQDVRQALTNYPRGKAFLLSAMHRFSPKDVYDWFEAHDVPLKIEEDGRVFPQSDTGRDVVGVFERLFSEDDRAQVLLNTQVERIEREGSMFCLRLKGSAEAIRADVVVLTTGGQAYRHTGSTGDGYAFAQHLGHGLTPLAPSLNAFFTQESWVREISGVSFASATITAHRAGTPSRTGSFMFTHKGITGPAVFALSSKIAFETYDATHPLAITIDLLPDLSEQTLIERIEHLRHLHPKKSLENLFSLLVPKSLAAIMCERIELDPTLFPADLRKEEMRRIANWMKNAPLTVVARGAGDEFVTAGGVPLNEVDPSTMESTMCPGLFFAGEILDIDGFTGGFNLQASWATGRAAGLALVKRNSL